METTFCWESMACSRTCPVKESRTLFCWRVARVEGFRSLEQCEVCSYRKKWFSGEYSLAEFIRKNDRRSGDRATSRILVVDDEPNILYALEETVRAEGYDCISALDGDEGLFLARQIRPDLIISDVIMPKINGYELCTTVKRENATRHIPVILVTVRGMMKDRTLGEDAGADAYLIKPFHAQELAEMIGALIPAKT